MLGLLWTVPAFPLAGFLALTLAGGRLSRRAGAAVGVASVGLSTLAAGAVAAAFLASPPAGAAYTQHLWRWLEMGSFAPEVSLRLDSLSLLMVLVVTVVGFLIHLYSVEFMEADPASNRFFAWLNLFVGSMLVLVLAGDLLLLYLGFEAVGLASFLLIGFWHRDPANARAARKAFLVTRAGDTAFAIGLLVLFSLGTSDVADLTGRARASWPAGSAAATAAAALVLGGCLGKSAQVPLHIWLPDAMAGPTPVSALIHAATMVTAGVYLIARLHGLFLLAPAVLAAVAALGAVTLLLAAGSALVERDLKRILAYSTMSQVGYMFLALGAGAWSAAIFHLLTHAFFKALLFLAAGVVIQALHEEHNVFRMGGLRRELPLAFWTFLAGAASLAALPLVTAGFYSKELILSTVWEAGSGGRWLWLAGLLGAFLTSLYAFRMMFVVFFGPPASERPAPAARAGALTAAPLVLLAALSLAGGFLETPEWLGGARVLSNFLETSLPAPPGGPAHAGAGLAILAIAAALGGVALAAVLYLGSRRRLESVVGAPALRSVQGLAQRGFGFDALYAAAFVRPFERLANINRDDFVDGFYRALAAVTVRGHDLLARTQNGKVRWYAGGLVVGGILILGLVLLL